MARWLQRRGTTRVVVSITVYAVVVSSILCLAVFMVSYGGIDGMKTQLDVNAVVLPIVIPILVAPPATLQLAGALGVASSLISELELAHIELEAEVARREAAQTELERLARSDPLTGLLNRRGFFDSLSALGSEDLSALVLVTADIDRFKTINDAHGHAFGDRVLCAVGEVLTATAGRQAIVARMGGDEFVAALVGGDVAVDELRRVLSGVIVDRVDGDSLAVRCSVGSASHSSDGSIDVTLARADVALYHDKPGYRGSGRTRSSAR